MGSRQREKGVGAGRGDGPGTLVVEPPEGRARPPSWQLVVRLHRLRIFRRHFDASECLDQSIERSKVGSKAGVAQARSSR